MIFGEATLTSLIKFNQMKRGIFNKYVDYVCQETGVTRKTLFKKNRSAKYSTARFLLYTLCYERPMTIVQIVDLMAENGYVIARAGVEYGIRKIMNSGDIDANEFISKGLESCSHETSVTNV
jgi:hypothetical protein